MYIIINYNLNFFFFLIKGRRITREFGEKEFKNRPAEYTIKFCVTRS
jgi:hypothetical protein